MLNFDLWKQTQFFLGFFKKLLTAYWPSLLVLLLGICLPLLVFEELAVVIWRNDGSFAWDESLLLAIHQTAQPQLDTFAVIFTKLGVSWGVIPVATAIALVLLRLRRWRSLTYFVIALLGNGLINRIAKEFLHRVRPSLWESISPEFDSAFPSGHAMSSMSFIAALVILT
jgi:undecaprenyl-diphosphatase